MRWVWDTLKASLIIILLVKLLLWTGIFDSANDVALALSVRFQSQFREPLDKIAVVEIGPSDYADYFDSHSPLKPDQVLRLVADVIDAGASEVGVDLVTSDAVWATTMSCLDSGTASDNNCKSIGADATILSQMQGWRKKIQEAAVPVYWAQTPKQLASFSGGFALGGFASASCSALAVLPVSSSGRPGWQFDWHTAEISKNAKVTCHQATPESSPPKAPPEATRALPSLAWALAHPGDQPSDEGERYLILYHDLSEDHTRFPSPTPVPAGHFLHQPPSSASSRDSQLQGKIVLIGGTFPESQDTFETPFGMMYGVFVIAQAVADDLKPSERITEASSWKEILLDLIAAFSVAGIFHRFEQQPGKAFWLSIAAGAALSIFGMFVVSHTLGFWFPVMPVIAGMLIHQMWEQKKIAQELARGKHANVK